MSEPVLTAGGTRIRYTSCPLCQASSWKPICTANCNTHPLYEPSLPPMMTWCKCSGCGHVFTEGYFTPEAASLIFGRANTGQRVGANLEAQRVVSARMVERVASHVPDGHWLDVGFGNAALLFTAAEWGYVPVGLDLREENVAALRALDIEAHVLDCTQLEPRARGRFSVVSMADVLEHMPFPREGLTAVHGLLRPGGVLLVSMPNSDSMVWRLLDRDHVNPYWGELEHFHNFSRARLYALLDEHGFDPIAYGVSERYRACMEVIARRRA